MSEDVLRRIVSDTGPLISLEKISGGYRFVRRLYDRLLVPPAVLYELAAGAFESEAAYLRHYEIGDLIEVRAPTQPESKEEFTRRLDEGERQAIRLALETGLPLLVEEQAGREVARELVLKISGIAGQVLRSVRINVLPHAEAKGMLVQLKATGRINREVFDAVHNAINDTV
jgi:predicted nucleic acid-binding protein